MNVHKLSQQFDIAEWLAAASRGVGNIDSASIDLTQYSNAEITALISIGGIGASATVLVKFQESDDNSTFTDAAGTDATTAAIAANGSATLAKRTRSFTKRYVRLRGVVATAASVFSVTRVAQKLNPNGV